MLYRSCFTLEQIRFGGKNAALSFRISLYRRSRQSRCHYRGLSHGNARADLRLTTSWSFVRSKPQRPSPKHRQSNAVKRMEGLIQGDKPSGASGTSNAGKSPVHALTPIGRKEGRLRENGSVIPRPKGRRGRGRLTKLAPELAPNCEGQGVIKRDNDAGLTIKKPQRTRHWPPAKICRDGVHAST